MKTELKQMLHQTLHIIGINYAYVESAIHALARAGYRPEAAVCVMRRLLVELACEHTNFDSADTLSELVADDSIEVERSLRAKKALYDIRAHTPYLEVEDHE